MIRINLLPKEERARRRSMPTIRVPQIGTVVPFAALGVVILVVATIATLHGREISRLRKDVAEQRAEAERYKPQLEKIRQITQKREEVRARLDIIARLDRQRYYRVQLLDEITKSVPENCWITNVTELSERRYQLDGVTFSNFIVARFMDNLVAKDRWTDVELDVAEKGDIEDLEVVKFTVFSNAQP